MIKLPILYKWAVIAGFFLCCSNQLYGQQADKNSSQRTFKLFEFDHHRSISSDKATFRDWNVYAAVPAVTNKNLVVIALPNFRHTSVTKVNFSLPTNDFYNVSLPVIIQKPVSSTKNWGALLIPGVASGFDKPLASRDFTFLAGLFIGNRQPTRFQYRYGIVYSRSVNGNLILPAVSFDWRPTNRLRINANNPLNPDVTYKITPRLQAGLEYTRITRNYNMHDGTYLKEIESSIDPHFDINLYGPLILTARGGYAFKRKIETYRNVDIGASWFEGFKKKDPIDTKKRSGWFIEAGLSIEVGR